MLNKNLTNKNPSYKIRCLIIDGISMFFFFLGLLGLQLEPVINEETLLI